MKEGNTVKFVSGEDPVMSIVKILTSYVDGGDKGTGNILCKWWDSKESNFKEYYFNASELSPYKPGPGAMVGGHRKF